MGLIYCLLQGAKLMSLILRPDNQYFKNKFIYIIPRFIQISKDLAFKGDVDKPSTKKNCFEIMSGPIVYKNLFLTKRGAFKKREASPFFFSFSFFLWSQFLSCVSFHNTKTRQPKKEDKKSSKEWCTNGPYYLTCPGVGSETLDAATSFPR